MFHIHGVKDGKKKSGVGLLFRCISIAGIVPLVHS